MSLNGGVPAPRLAGDEADVTLAGEPVVLLAARALWWPRRRTLVVADTHFGKGAALRRAGLAVPAGTSAGDLARLAALVRAKDAARLLVLGDLVHGRLEVGEPFLEGFQRWREELCGVELVAARGNHDRRLGCRLPGIRWEDTALWEPPFVFRHEPAPDPRGYVLAGHLHPVARLAAGGDRLRAPAFVLDPAVGVLPAFGALTGGHPVAGAPQRRRYAATPAGLLGPV